MFYYYGGKRSLADRYPPPAYPLIVEPFAGAAGYAMHHLLTGSAERALLIEKDPRVVEVWRRLLSMTSEEIRAIPIPEAGTKTSDFLLMTSATSNAVARCRQMTVTSRMPKILRVMLARIASTIDVVRDRVEIVEGTYEEACAVEATWYVDPPYQIHADKVGSAKTVYPQGMGYSRDCSADSVDYAVLGDWCRGLPGQVIVVEQEGADWLPFRRLALQHDSMGKRKSEMIWTGDSA